MSKEMTLEQVVAEFEHWRAVRPSRSAATPVALRQQAVALSAHYSHQQIISALHLSGGQYKQWLAESIEPSSPAETMTFVALPSVAVDPLCAVLHHPQGCRLELSGLSDGQLACLVRSFTHGEVVA